MSFDFEAPEDVQGDGGNYLSEPGTYHFLVKDVKEGVGPKGNAIDGFSLELETLAGTTDDCKGKVHSETLFAPNVTHKETAQLAARRRLAAFFIATDLMGPSSLGKRQSIELVNAADRQIVMKLVRQMEKDDDGKFTVPTKYLQIDYASIYHVDDPEVADIPKDQDAISLIAPKFRHEPQWFAFKEKRSAKQPVAAAATKDDFADL